MDAGDHVREALVGSFDEIIGYSVQSAGLVQGDRVKAVHEFRKSVRRARALVSLIRHAMPKREYRKLRQQLSSAARPTSGLRDHDVFPDVLRGVEVPDKLMTAAERAQARLAEATHATDSVEVVLREGAERVSEIPPRFESAVPSDLDWKSVERGLRRSYKSARDALAAARKSRSVDDFHDWRKRTKELNYQLELLTFRVGGRIRLWRRALSAFATHLGAVTDRMNLARHLRKSSKKKSGRRLAKAVRKEGKRMLARALDEGTELFEERPKVFARNLIAAVRAAHRERLDEAAGR
jgi:CHAD domain-containing protein